MKTKIISFLFSSLVLICGFFSFSCVTTNSGESPEEPVVITEIENNYELMIQGFWSSDVDPTGLVEPNTQNEEELQTGSTEEPLEVRWVLEPDLENGGSIWTWGELTCYFNEGETPLDISNVTSIELTYSSTADLYARWIQSPPVTEGGAQHRFPVNSTEGEFQTVSLDPSLFAQPGWTSSPVSLKLESMAAFQIIPVLPQGGECELKIRSVRFLTE